MRMIGAAADFWRVRLTRVDTTSELDFEWHEDILYRQPATASTADVELWHVEAVRTDDYDSIVRIATLRSRTEAESYFARITEDLSEMTKSQFEEIYLTPGSPQGEPSNAD